MAPTQLHEHLPLILPSLGGGSFRRMKRGGGKKQEKKRYDGMLGWKMRPNKEMGIGIKSEVKDESEGQWET